MTLVLLLPLILEPAAAEAKSRDAGVLLTRRTVSPAALPVPRFKLSLLPPDADRTPTNAAVEYMRAVALMPAEPKLSDEQWRERFERHDRWATCSIDKLPAADVRAELMPYRAALDALDRAARAARCEWDVPRPISLKQINREPELHKLREAMDLLRFRCRAELAEGRHADALRTVQTAFQAARHVGERPTLIAAMVGLAFTAYAHGMAADLISAPGSPNLYWALADLPDPLLDLRPALAGEREMLRTTLPVFPAFAGGPVSDAEARRLLLGCRSELRDTIRVTGMFGAEAPRTPEGWVNAWAGDFAVVWQAGPAKEWLKARGRADADAMPPVQAVYLAAWMRYEEAADVASAPFRVPAGRAVETARRAEQEYDALMRQYDGDRLFVTLIHLWGPAYQKLFEAHLRGRRQLAVLQAVEAIRAHLADAGRLPAEWAEVTAVPIPDDPRTGRPFEYAIRDGMAVLDGPPRVGRPSTTSTHLRYEIRPR